MPLPDVSHEWKERRWHYSLLVHNPWGTTRAVARPAAAHVSDAGEFRAGGLAVPARGRDNVYSAAFNSGTR